MHFTVILFSHISTKYYTVKTDIIIEKFVFAWYRELLYIYNKNSSIEQITMRNRYFLIKFSLVRF